MTLMWEVRATPGRFAELLALVLAQADPSAQVYRGAGSEGAESDRLVLIDPTGRGVVDVPEDLLARAPHRWQFEPVRR